MHISYILLSASAISVAIYSCRCLHAMPCLFCSCTGQAYDAVSPSLRTLLVFQWFCIGTFVHVRSLDNTFADFMF